MKKSVFGLNENIASLIAYVGFSITGIIMFIVERENKTVRFHALQSVVLFGILGLVRFLARLLLGWLPLIGGIIPGILTLVIVLSWLLLMFTAYKGIVFKVPFIGEICWAQANKE